MLVIPAIVLSGFRKNTIGDYVKKGNSRPRGKLWGVFPTHALPHLFLHNFHPSHGHLVPGCCDLQLWVFGFLMSSRHKDRKVFNYKISVNII